MNSSMKLEVTVDQEPRLFAALRRAEEWAVAGEGAGGGVAVQLRFDEGGAYLQIIDDKGRPREAAHRATRGPLRDLLKAMALIQRRQQDLVGWESSSDRIYLHHHEHMLWPLRNGAALVGEDMQPLAFVPGNAEIVLDLVADPAKNPTWLAGQLLLIRDGETLARTGEFRFINETHVLVGRQIYETPPVGENFRRLELFASTFPETMLERSLSLLFSHFTGVTVGFSIPPCSVPRGISTATMRFPSICMTTRTPRRSCGGRSIRSFCGG
jgi:hypothetical protein